jgi:hypothetical protein
MDVLRKLDRIKRREKDHQRRVCNPLCTTSWELESVTDELTENSENPAPFEGQGEELLKVSSQMKNLEQKINYLHCKFQIAFDRQTLNIQKKHLLVLLLLIVFFLKWKNSFLCLR